MAEAEGGEEAEGKGSMGAVECRGAIIRAFEDDKDVQYDDCDE